MTKESLIKIRDGMNELQKECCINQNCETCFFYNRNLEFTKCQIQTYIEYDCEEVGKLLSLQYGKYLL